MEAGIARYGRTILAALSAALMVLSMMFVLAAPADAEHDPHEDTVANDGPAGTNEGPYWVNYLQTERGITGATCEKISQDGSDAWIMPAEPDGEDWVLLVVKQGETNFVFYDPIAGHAYPSAGENSPGFSHIIVCSVEEPEETTTTTVEDTTTTTVDDTTTTTVDDTTTTTVEDTTTTTVEDTTTTTVEDTTTTTVEDTTTTEPEVGEIIVEKEVLGTGSQVFEFTFDTGGFTLADNTLAHGQSSSSGDIPAGDGYSVSEDVPPGWTLVGGICDDGSPTTNIDVEAGETVTCTFTNLIDDEVQAAIFVNAAGTCVEDDGEGEGVISVTVSVDGGATVVIRDSDNDVMGTFTSDGSVTVPEGATYTWAATPSEGFEFPSGADSSGSITIETCSDPETLPFTGLNLDTMATVAGVLLGAGLLMLLAMRREEEA